MRTKLRQNVTGLLFLLPALVLFAVFVVYPIVYNVQASTLDWDGVNPGTFIGFDNYVKLVQDPTFLITLRNSAYWIPLTIVPQALIGFLLALALNRGIFASTVYRAIFFIPAILSPVVVGIVWQRIMDPFNGVFSSVGKATGLDWLGGNFLSDPNTAIFAVLATAIWATTGFVIVIFLSALRNVDAELVDAATPVDPTGGAT